MLSDKQYQHFTAIHQITIRIKLRRKHLEHKKLLNLKTVEGGQFLQLNTQNYITPTVYTQGNQMV